MVRIAFLLNFTLDYKGGINYFKNLLYAIDRYQKNNIEALLFLPSDIDEDYIRLFEDNVKIVRTSILKRYSPLWSISKVLDKFFRFDILTYLLLRKHKINIVSHSNYISPFKNLRTINWIPDFQYYHYPQLWTEKQLKLEYNLHDRWIKYSDKIVVSSYDALNDLLSRYPNKKNLVKVLHFVSQPSTNKTIVYSSVEKYTKKPYFFLPNQFWQHKNHKIVFEAINELKKSGIEITLLTSGLIHDFRSKNEYVASLLSYVEDNKLQENILFLGLIPYEDVLALMKYSIAVINPSLFEGWSSSVEEAKSMEKLVILSNIGVHREQNPAKSIFFDPNNHIALSEILKKTYLLTGGEIDLDVPDRNKIALEQRTKDFANKYYEIVNSVG